MARLPSIKRIAKEDFPAEEQSLVEKLSYPINSFFEEIRNLLNKNLDFTNLNQEVVTILVTVVSGIPKVKTQYKSNLRTRVQGMNCISASNLDSPTTFPVSGVLASFTQETNTVIINHITGLQDNMQYSLKFISYGS